jgi:hypothetical protein
MRKLFVIGVMSTAILCITACNKNNGCPNNSEKARIRDFTGSDTCDYVIQLEDGTKLEPTNLSEYPFVTLEEGQLVWVKYKAASGASLCDQGDIVKLKCLSERDF